MSTVQEIVMPHTPEWHAARRRVITATDVARIMVGEGFTVFSEKRGDVEPFAGNEFTEDGQILEEPTLRLYAKREKCEVRYPLPFVIDPGCPSLGASPDAERLDSNVGIEVKTCRSRTLADQLGDEDSDEAIPRWIWQGQSQCACKGWDRVDIPVLLWGSLRIFRVHRHEQLVAQCRAIATEYMERVANNDPPPIVFENAANQQAIKNYYKPVAGKVIDLGQDALDVATKWRDASAEESAAKKRKEACDAMIRTMLAGAAFATLPDGATIKFGTVDVAEKVVGAYSYSRLYWSKPKTKK